MGTKSADIVFCLDISTSMQPCIDEVKRQIHVFVDAFEHTQLSWDLRLGLLAHRATQVAATQRVAIRNHVLHGKNGVEADRLIYSGSESLFTSNVSVFLEALDDLATLGDEAMLVALDYALDFPWREANTCHRVVVMMTDEPIEDGLMRRESEAVLEDLLRKIMNLQVMLFIVGPDSDALDRLAAADRSEYEAVENSYDGLREVDFRKLLRAIAKSVSVSSFGQQSVTARKALFGQDSWGSIQNVEFSGR